MDRTSMRALTKKVNQIFLGKSGVHPHREYPGFAYVSKQETGYVKVVIQLQKHWPTFLLANIRWGPFLLQLYACHTWYLYAFKFRLTVIQSTHFFLFVIWKSLLIGDLWELHYCHADQTARSIYFTYIQIRNSWSIRIATLPCIISYDSDTQRYTNTAKLWLMRNEATNKYFHWPCVLSLIDDFHWERKSRLYCSQLYAVLPRCIVCNAVFPMSVCPSVCPSVCQTRELWQNEST